MSAERELLSHVRAAVDRYGMIPDGSSIAVGVSGGKDSLCALFALARLREFYPNKFTVKAVSADMNFFGRPTDFSAVTEFCAKLGVEHFIRPTELYRVIFEERREKNPCSLCARMRRGILHAKAKEIGCGIVALGHHADDAAETVMMNLLRGGRFEGLPAKSWLDRREITVIRPLIFCSEKLCTRVAKEQSFPVVKSDCPVDGDTERARVRQLIEELSADYPDIKAKLTGAAQRLHDSL